MNRRPVLAVVSAVVAVMALTGWRLSAGPAFPPAPASSLPTVRTGALDQEWYCAVATAQSGGQAAGALVLLNASRAVLHGVVTVYPNQGTRSRSRAFALGPWSRVSLDEASVVSAPFVAATVVFYGGGGSVDQQVAGPLGLSASPCATDPSPDWYFATGTTEIGASLVVALFNPFSQEALADLNFADGQGQVQPSAFQGIFVPGHSVVTVDVGQHVVQVPDVATTVTVRVGRLVASELQLDAVPGQLGISLNLGAPAPASAWYLPDGVVAPGVGESVHLYDPTSRSSQVSVDVELSQGHAAPFEISLAPYSEYTLDLAHQTRVPPNDPYAAMVSASGAPVVVQRSVNAGPPSTRTGSATMLAAPTTARVWQLAAGGASPSQDEWVEVFDPGPRPVTISVSAPAHGADATVPGLGHVVVAPGTRSAIRLGDHIEVADLSLIVRASRPVVVERDLYQVGSPGISLSLGDPVS